MEREINMSKLLSMKYVLMIVLLLIFLVAGSFIESHDYLDAVYLLFIFTCIIRYIIICKTDRD